MQMGFSTAVLRRLSVARNPSHGLTVCWKDEKETEKKEEAIQCPLLAVVSARGSRVAVVVVAVAKPLPLERRREREREKERRKKRECKRSRTRSSLSLLTFASGLSIYLCVLTSVALVVPFLSVAVPSSSVGRSVGRSVVAVRLCALCVVCVCQYGFREGGAPGLTQGSRSPRALKISQSCKKS